MSTSREYFESVQSDNRALFCMVFGLDEDEFPWSLEKEPFTDYRYPKEVKPLNKHLKAEIARRQMAYGFGKDVRPKNWKKDKLEEWLTNNPIPESESDDLSFLKEELSALEEKIRNKNEFPSHEDLLPETKRNKWRYSKAKEILRAAIISGEVTSNMNAKDVYEMNEEYKKWPYKNFPSNLKSLRDTVESLYSRMQSDCVAYGHDLTLLKKLRAGNPPIATWHRSDAKYILKQDINNGKHKEMKPMELYNMRKEYQAFDLKTFRNHIYQEVDSRAKRDHRFAKKKKREAVKHALDKFNSSHN